MFCADLTLHFERASSHHPGVAIRQGYALDFLAGVNGTGKTTALQFIARVFAHLYSSDHFAEPFDLTYTLGALAGSHSGSQVRISNIPAEDEQPNSQYGQFQYQVGPDKTGTGKVPGGDSAQLRDNLYHWQRGRMGARVVVGLS